MEEIPKQVKRIVLSVMIVPILLLPNIAGSIEYIRPEESVDSLITVYAKRYGIDEQLARDIIRCESNFHEDAINKKAVVGEDVGIFQLNSYYWQDYMAERGWDIYNTKDNIQAGMWLLSTDGVKHWSWSAHCHHHI